MKTTVQKTSQKRNQTKSRNQIKVIAIEQLKKDPEDAARMAKSHLLLFHRADSMTEDFNKLEAFGGGIINTLHWYIVHGFGDNAENSLIGFERIFNEIADSLRSKQNLLLDAIRSMR